MKSHSLGTYLKSARRKKRLTAVEVAQCVGIESPLTVLAWERDHGEVLPLTVLRQLVSLYELNVERVFDLLLHYQISRIDVKFKKLVEREKPLSTEHAT